MFFFSTLVLIVSNFIVACAFVTCYENLTYLLTYLLITVGMGLKFTVVLQ